MIRSDACSRNTSPDLGKLNSLQDCQVVGVRSSYWGRLMGKQRQRGSVSDPTTVLHSLGRERLSQSSSMNGAFELGQRQ